MLTRVQRELSTVHPMSLYKKQNSFNGAPNRVSFSANSTGPTSGSGSADNTVGNTVANNIGAKRRIQKIISEVKERREMRERKKSELQGLDGSEIDLTEYSNTEFQRKTKYYKEKLQVYNFLNSPQGFWARSYHIGVFILVFTGLIVTVFSNIDKFAWKSSAWKFIYLFEKIIIIWFGFEFILRLWSSSCKQQYEGWKGKIKYLSVPAHVLDIIIIVSSLLIVIPVHTRNGSEVFAVSAFRGFHRFFSVLQIVTLNRQLQPWKVLSSVIYDQREQLFIIFYIEFIVLCILAYISYIVEKDENEQFDNIAEAMWYSVVTLATVGYGDRVPTTWLGKLISSIFTVLGVAIFALPAGIIGAGLALKIEEEERNRQRKKKKVAAATLIQCTWRCYKASIKYTQTSTFFLHKPTDIFKFHYFETIEKKFICLTKFFIAKKRFIELLRPLDIKSIIESYKYGQLDVMSRVSHMQTTIDTIGTRVNLNENYIQNSQSALNTRIASIESLIGDIEAKLDKQNEILKTFSSHLVLDNRFYDFLDNVSKKLYFKPNDQ